ncbi:MAG: TetR/AcrR family transcriptional regulator [Clostridia bacterium]|nr:TetR/AcrR family transcriptional regulator [Clostridia bacterium]
MQIKKETMKENILLAAESEFLEKGFQKASIRNIVSKSNTTIGNFYNYFENKEAVFKELIMDVYVSFKYLLENHDTIERVNYLWEISDVHIWRKELLVYIKNMMPNLNNRFLLLVDCSDGTPYAHVKTDLISLLSSHFMEHVNEFSPDYPFDEMASILSHQFFMSMIQILKTTKEDNRRSELMIEQFLFFAIGTMGLLKGEAND